MTLSVPVPINCQYLFDCGTQEALTPSTLECCLAWSCEVSTDALSSWSYQSGHVQKTLVLRSTSWFLTPTIPPPPLFLGCPLSLRGKRYERYPSYGWVPQRHLLSASCPVGLCVNCCSLHKKASVIRSELRSCYILGQECARDFYELTPVAGPLHIAMTTLLLAPIFTNLC